MSMITTTNRVTGDPVDVYYYSLHRNAIILAATRSMGGDKIAWKAYVHIVPGVSHALEAEQMYHADDFTDHPEQTEEAYRRGDGCQMMEHLARPFFANTPLNDIPYCDR